MKFFFSLILLICSIPFYGQQKVVRYPFKWTYTGNPVVNHMYTADPTARVFNDTLYVYCSTDQYPCRGCDFMDKYHIFSTPDLKTWTDHGEILRAEQVPWGREEGGFMWAPDCVYANGKYYYYFPHPSGDDWTSTWKIGICISDRPDGGFQVQENYMPNVPSGIDPNVFIDDDGQAYFYLGGSGYKAYGVKLKPNMIEPDGEFQVMEGLVDFHEGPFVFKRKGKYYLMYPDNHTDQESDVFGNRMRYAMSDSPLGPWEYKGILLDPTGSHTTHGSVVEFKGNWYLFYHNSALSGEHWLRSFCFDKLYFKANGEIEKVVQTGDFDKADFMPGVKR